MGKDIVCLKENTEGRDFIIGDIHGNRRCLNEVLSVLKNEDRLFIVGDLTDRGHDSEGVILALKNRDNVFSVRGNHEDECLEVIHYLEDLALKHSCLFKSRRFKDYLRGNGNHKLTDLFADFNIEENDRCAEIYKKMKFDLENDRGWLVDLFCRELRNHDIKISQDNIKYGRRSRIKQIQEYMRNLPYIIHVAGNNPFNVVHADMPFDNSFLLELIQQGNFRLTKDQRKHATWARGDEQRPFLNKTNSNGVITYVGHNIIEGNDLPIVRRDSNTVNIDVGTYDINSSLVVNHTNKKSRFIGLDRPPTNLLAKKENLDEYLLSVNTNKVTKKRSLCSMVNFFEQAKKRKQHHDVVVHIFTEQDLNVNHSA
jgi:hypothetical protein